MKTLILIAVALFAVSCSDNKDTKSQDAAVKTEASVALKDGALPSEAKAPVLEAKVAPTDAKLPVSDAKVIVPDASVAPKAEK